MPILFPQPPKFPGEFREEPSKIRFWPRIPCTRCAWLLLQQTVSWIRMVEVKHSRWSSGGLFPQHSVQ